jgi:pyruvate dehydrogenase E2 component (dihydrolipoamide acetyltransferase)
MAVKIIMPHGGQDINEGKVVNWLKAESEPVKKGEIVCVVETEKAVFEVEAPADGILVKIIVPEGGVAPIFSTIGVIGEAGETVDLDSFLGEGKKEETSIDISKIRKRMEGEGEQETGRVKVSGRARKLATQRGIDPSEVTGTGPNGRIVEKDVIAYMEERKTDRPQASRPSVATERGRAVPMSKMRRVIARRMQQSKQTIPHFYVTVSVVMDEATALRKTLNQVAEPKISVNDMLVKASALALEEFYQVNAAIEGNDLVYLADVNIGIAVGVEDGLIVPVLPRANTLSLKEIAKQSKEIISLVQAGKQPNLETGSFTVSNMGMLNVENFVAIINPPESAILAIGSTEKRVIVSSNNDLSIRDVMTMTLSVDHRIVDGVLASKFINKIKYHLQNPKTLVV